MINARTTVSTLQAIILLLIACQTSPQNKTSQKSDSSPAKGSPAWLVEMFFKQKDFPDKLGYYTGEMQQMGDRPTIGSGIPANVVTTYRSLESDSMHAIYAINYRDTSNGQDWYCFLKRDNVVWKIEAVRCLALPGYVYMLLDSSKRMPPLPDSLRRVQNSLRLLTQSDEHLKQYLRDHLEQFMKLVSSSQADSIESRKLCDELNVLSCESSTEYKGCTFVTIGGIVDNTAGYIYAADGAKLPRMTPSEYIYIEEVLPHWYIFKTT